MMIGGKWVFVYYAENFKRITMPLRLPIRINKSTVSRVICDLLKHTQKRRLIYNSMTRPLWGVVGCLTGEITVIRLRKSVP